jgi:hypothetical protein
LPFSAGPGAFSLAGGGPAPGADPSPAAAPPFAPASPPAGPAPAASAAAAVASTSSDTAFIVIRRSIEVFWIHRNASASVGAPPAAGPGPVEQLADLQPVAQRADLGFQRGDLLEPADRDLDGRHQVRLGERFDQVGHGARVPGPLDQLTLRERGQDDDRGKMVGGDPLGRRDPVQDRHLHIQDDKIRPEALGEGDGVLAVSGLAGHDVAFLFEHLPEVEPDQSFVFGDHNSKGRLGHPLSVPKGRYIGLARPRGSPVRKQNLIFPETTPG